MSELEDLDWFYNKSTGVSRPFVKPVYYSIMDVASETPFERKLRMLRPLSLSCTACSMCELGKKGVNKNDIVRDPHIFSNMNPTRFVLVGGGPGWEELKAGTPFSGPIGKDLDRELSKNGLSRRDFYVTNIIKCYADAEPSEKQKKRCGPFLQMELNLIRPLLVVAIGEVAFSGLCPGLVFSDNLKKIVRSDVFDVSVFVMCDVKKAEFSEQARVLGGLVRGLG